MRRFRPYFSYLKPVRGAIAAAIFYTLIFAVTSGAGVPALIKYVFPPIFDPEIALSLSTVALIAACIPVAFLLRAWSGYRSSYFTEFAGVRVLEAIRLDYFRKLQVLTLSFLQSKSSGDLVSRGLADTAQLQTVLKLLASDGIKQPAQLLAALGFLIAQAFTERGVGTVLIALAAIPLTVLPIRYVGRKVIKRAAHMQHQLGSVTAHFSENLSAAREVRAFSLEEREISRFAAVCRELVLTQMKIAKYAQALTPTIEFVSALGIAATLVFAHSRGVELKVFASVVTALYLCYEPLKKIGTLNSELKRGTAALDRLEVVLDEPVGIADPPNPVPVDRLRGDVSFENVEFAYKSDLPVLHHVSVTIPAGTVCALVGPSGAGKSTFANLVPRFYEAADGRVAIDGIGVREMRLADLRRNIALVSQDPVLFNDTVLANLLLGRAGATRAEVEQAARDAFAHDFIVTLHQGYDTMVGERGAALSGGQRQRIALARAFLRNAPLLILDEATSALDSESEASIQAALQKLMVGKTVLIIAHRFSTIRAATRILVFDRGQIVASGSHGELYRSSPLYKSLFDRQHTLELQPVL
jgi:subfamily B ATP-binding cassette protein MsbA